jgi:hypothetical protein
MAIRSPSQTSRNVTIRQSPAFQIADLVRIRDEPDLVGDDAQMDQLCAPAVPATALSSHADEDIDGDFSAYLRLLYPSEPWPAAPGLTLISFPFGITAGALHDERT